MDEATSTEKAYEVELDALELARKLNHSHLVRFVAGFKQAGKRYLMFQWVDGGNLREFWQNPKSWKRDYSTVKWALQQMLGLATALERLHNYGPDPEKHCRHGDLKPENIVRCT
jgi:serine/threonine protein kinase